MMNIVPGQSITYADVLEWAAMKRQADDQRALARVAQLWDNVPLAARKADLAAFERKFPLHGFEPNLHKSEAAYKAWRRKVIAVLKAYAADKAPQPVRPIHLQARAQVSGWDDLLAEIDRVTDNETGAALYRHQRAIPIRTLARLAKAQNFGPKDLTVDTLRALAKPLIAPERDSLIRALRNLNMMRAVPAIAAQLPEAAYPLDILPRRGAIEELPQLIAQEIEGWLDVSCGGKWDPVAQVKINGTSTHDRAKKGIAMRRFCATAFKETPELMNVGTIAELLTEETVTLVLRAWMREEHNPLSARSITSYFVSIKVVAAHNGHDVSVFDNLKETATVLKEGKTADKSMSPKTRKFCASMLDNPALQTKLLTLHIRARRVAEMIFDRAEKEQRKLSTAEVGRIRQLGAVAAFSAIETCAAPYRIERMTQFRLSGPKADVLLPSKGIPAARFLLPEVQNKNKRVVAVSMKQDKRNGLDTLLWYVKRVRPLFDEAGGSEYLFPAVQSPGPMRKTMLTGWFKKLSRQLGVPMTPHNFRHAIASMLIKRHPGQYEAVAVLLGDTERTVRTYYAWVNARVQIEAAQSLVLGLADAA